ncbi:MAG: AIPR family protein [Proteobacteria bacterium]|nr:AIPR family protein [Pseudomonadota bacterium]MBU4296468.1 AIPR family protein [Pseudomonadota bacterium]MCG2748756.1 AIPR family protein [Desulfobulbaceae bacterium]
MTVETPIEMLHLPENLRKLFAGKLPDATTGTPEEREKNYLSRALAAFATHKLGGATLDEAVASIVDGGGDEGIDAIFHAAATNILWITQSKFIANGRGEPELGDVTKFKAGIENLLQGNFDAFRTNAAWNRLIPQIEAVFGKGGLLVRAVLVYSGINLVSEDRRRLFEDLKSRFSHDTDYLEVRVCNLTTVHDWMTGADQGPGVPEVELTLLKPGWVKEPYETVYGLLPLAELANLYALHGRRLIAANIRAYKGNTAVNEQIVNTVCEEPEHFFYLNNGLTAYCERIEVHNLDRANAEQKRVKGYGFSIINGAQTLGSVAQSFATVPVQTPQGFVFLKIVSLERCPGDKEFADRITRSTNFQNQIGLRDFVALDDQQEIIANQLTLSGISYHYKQDAEMPVPDATNFTLAEATTACACLAQQRNCDFCSRVLGNRKSLWSLDEIYPPEEFFRSRYSRVFLPDRSARNIWRAVQAQRLVIEAMQGNARASNGVRKAFFENARWLVLNFIFLKLRPEQGEDLALSAAEIASISRATNEFAEILWGVCETQGFVSRRTIAGTEIFEQTRHFRSVFCSSADCERLRNALLAKLATQPPNLED